MQLMNILFLCDLLMRFKKNDNNNNKVSGSSFWEKVTFFIETLPPFPLSLLHLFFSTKIQLNKHTSSTKSKFLFFSFLEDEESVFCRERKREKERERERERMEISLGRQTYFPLDVVSGMVTLSNIPSHSEVLLSKSLNEKEREEREKEKKREERGKREERRERKEKRRERERGRKRKEEECISYSSILCVLIFKKKKIE